MSDQIAAVGLTDLAFQLQSSLRRFEMADEALSHPAGGPLPAERAEKVATEYCRARQAHQEAIEAYENGLWNAGR